MKRPRDSQRHAVYAAERKLGWTKDPKIADINDVRIYIETVMASALWKSRFPKATKLILGDGRRRSSACGGPRGDDMISLKLPRAYRAPMIILHEMAHGVQPLESAWHGPEFCQIYLDLVTEFMGAERADKLRAALYEERVKIRVPRQLEAA